MSEIHQPGIVAPNEGHSLFLTIQLSQIGLEVKNLKETLKCVHCIVSTSEKNLPYAIAIDNVTSKILSHDKSTPSATTFLKQFPHIAAGLNNRENHLFVHVKHGDRGVLMDTSLRIFNHIPSEYIQKFDDIYGFCYLDSRDLSGFVDGINNPSTESDRLFNAVDPKDKSSYLITQKWLHDFSKLARTKDSELEEMIGRDRKAGLELSNKATSSHVAKMKGGNAFKQPPKYRIVRHSLPFGNIGGDAGLFFLAYSKTVDAFDFMLSQLFDPREPDRVLEFSVPVTSNYWIVPSVQQLEALYK